MLEPIDGWTVDAALGPGRHRCHKDDGVAGVVTVLPTPQRATVDRANALSRVTHPNLARVLEVREHAESCTVVVEWVDGRDLSGLVPPKLPRDRLLAIGAGIASALVDLHAAGLGHGAVRASHVLLGADDRPMLVSPRLDGGEPVEDVLGLGRILYALATGRPPPESAEPKPLDPGRVASLKLRELVRAATAPEPTERPPVAEILATLGEMATSRTPAPAARTEATPTRTTSTAIWTDRTGREFRLLAELGRGGFGTVHLAELRTAHGLARRVALKLLHTDLDPASQGVARMRDEAHVLARLEHPVIVAVEDLAEFDGRIGLVVEYVEGQDLSVLIAGADRMPLRAVLEVTSQVAAALDEAWRKLALVHRDVKPANVRIGRHGTVKLLDFGIARSRNMARASQTQANVLVGSFRYLAPERFAMDEDPEPPSDVFALGCVLFEAASGEQLFEDLDILDLLRITSDRDTFDAAVRARLSGPGASLPDPVRALIVEMLSFEPGERPTTADVAVRCEELSETIGASLGLRAWCRGRTWPEQPEGELPSATPAPAPSLASPVPETPSQSTLATAHRVEHPPSPPPSSPPQPPAEAARSIEPRVAEEPPASRSVPAAPVRVARQRSLGWWLTVGVGSLGIGGLSLLALFVVALVVMAWWAWEAAMRPPVAPEEAPVAETPVVEPVEVEAPPESEPVPVEEGVDPVAPTAPRPKRRTASPGATEPEVPSDDPVPEPIPEGRKPVVVRIEGEGITAVQVNCGTWYSRREPLVAGVVTVPDVPASEPCLAYFVSETRFDPRKIAAGDELRCKVDRRLKCE